MKSTLIQVSDTIDVIGSFASQCPNMFLFAQYASFYNVRNINYRLKRVGMSRSMLEHAMRTNLNRSSMDVQDT